MSTGSYSYLENLLWIWFEFYPCYGSKVIWRKFGMQIQVFAKYNVMLWPEKSRKIQNFLCFWEYFSTFYLRSSKWLLLSAYMRYFFPPFIQWNDSHPTLSPYTLGLLRHSFFFFPPFYLVLQVVPLAFYIWLHNSNTIFILSIWKSFLQILRIKWKHYHIHILVFW